MNKKALLDLLSQPTAPYREGHVISWIERYLVQQTIPFFKDAAGNLVLGVANEQEYRLLLSQAEREPLRVFVAHMDHPGFHGLRWKSSTTLEVKWFGGSPRKHLVGSKVWLSDGADWRGTGVIQSATLAPKKTHLVKAVIKLPKTVEKLEATTLFGGFGFRAPVWEKAGILYTKAADDLVGCFAVIEAAKKAVQSKPRKFIGLLTRAEEVGFVGCIAHVEQGWFRDAKRSILFISLETSRTLPGAIVGKGPVVRLGDKASIFTQSYLEVLTQIAQTKLGKKYQRRVMDGGTCEATVAVAHQIPAIGISIPLGNYHNQGFEGGPDCKNPEGPAPEFVSLSDIKGMLSLCEGLVEKELPLDPWEPKRKQLLKYLEEGKRLLETV